MNHHSGDESFCWHFMNAFECASDFSKTNMRWKLDFSRLVEGDGTFDKIAKAISSETFWRVEENSKDPSTSNIYLLNFSSF